MPRFAALDTKFILALAGGESDAEATIDYLHKTGFYPIVTESVLEQLGELSDSTDSMVRESAKYACKWMCTWGILTPSDVYADNGTAQIQAEKILEQQLIPGATTIEAESLVEAACHGCDLLVTFSQPLLDAPIAPLHLALIENHLNCVAVTIASPQIISQRLDAMNQAARQVQALAN